MLIKNRFLTENNHFRGCLNGTITKAKNLVAFFSLYKNINIFFKFLLTKENFRVIIISTYLVGM